MRSTVFKLGLLFFKIFMLIVFLVALFFLVYQYNNRLFVIEAKILLGDDKFLEDRFKNGSADVRGRMAADLIQGGYFLNTNISSLSKILGAPTGDYYYNDSNLTYKLTDRGNADWILTFVAGESGHVKTVFIRKSCCSVSRKFLDFLIQ